MSHFSLAADGILGLLGEPPRFVDPLGFVQAVDGFGQGIVVALPHASDGGFDTGFDEPPAVADR